jgi:hypothetical protein
MSSVFLHYFIDFITRFSFYPGGLIFRSMTGVDRLRPLSFADKKNRFFEKIAPKTCRRASEPRMLFPARNEHRRGHEQNGRLARCSCAASKHDELE